MRQNGLRASSFVAVADVDPRIADQLLDLLAFAHVAAYAEPVPGRVGVYRDHHVPTRPIDRLWVDREATGPAREVQDRSLAHLHAELETAIAEGVLAGGPVTDRRERMATGPADPDRRDDPDVAGPHDGPAPASQLTTGGPASTPAAVPGISASGNGAGAPSTDLDAAVEDHPVRPTADIAGAHIAGGDIAGGDSAGGDSAEPDRADLDSSDPGAAHLDTPGTDAAGPDVPHLGTAHPNAAGPDAARPDAADPQAAPDPPVGGIDGSPRDPEHGPELDQAAVDARWRDIVAGWDGPVADGRGLVADPPTGRRGAAASPPPHPRGPGTVWPTDAPPAPQPGDRRRTDRFPIDPARRRETRADGRPADPTGPRDHTPAPEDEHFSPPVPTAHPPLDRTTRLGWAGLVAGLVVLVVVVAVGSELLPRWVPLLGVALLVGGFVALVSRLHRSPTDEDDHDPDDGAVV